MWIAFHDHFFQCLRNFKNTWPHKKYVKCHTNASIELNNCWLTASSDVKRSELLSGMRRTHLNRSELRNKWSQVDITSLWEALDSSHRSIERHLNQELSALGLSKTSFLILNTLSKESSPVSTKRLLGISGLMPAAMTGMLNRMEAAKLCNRVEDSSDKRAIRIQITAMGQGQLAIATRIYENWISQNFGPLAQAESEMLATAAEVLQSIAEGLGTSARRKSAISGR